MKTIKSNILIWLQKSVKPVKEEFWFFLCVFFMMVQQPIEWFFLPTIDHLWLCMKFLQGLLTLLGVVYLFTLAIYFARPKWVKFLVKWALYFFFWLLMSITLFLTLNLQMSISQQALTVLVETNAKESAEFVNTYMLSVSSLISYAIDLVVAMVIVVGERKKDVLRMWLRKILKKHWIEYMLAPLSVAGAVLVVITLFTLSLCNDTHKLNRWCTTFPPESFDPFIQSLHAINSLRASDNDMQLALNQVDAVCKTHPSVEENDSLTVVYVLGESYNKHHASLYGYYLPTTPCMDRERAEGRLFAFTDVVSQANYTSVVEKNTFSINSVADGECWFDAPNFTTVFRRAGYDVWMWDMQRNWDASQMFTMTVNSYIYNDKIIKSSYTQCNKKRYNFDAYLINDFAKNVHFTSKHNLVIFHLLGQHVAYSNRYQHDTTKVNGKTIHVYEKFKTKDIKSRYPWLNETKKKVIADYDNATHYNDMVMDKIFTMFRNKNAVVVYLSDHGEEVYDFRDQFGRMSDHVPPPNMLRNQNEVPFVVWCSPRYQELHPDIMARIRASLRRPIMTDLVGQLLFDLGKVKTEYYRPDRDYISPQFKPRKRIMYDDRIDYDEVMATKK